MAERSAVYCFSPFLAVLGGGERYFAKILAALQDDFDVVWVVPVHLAHVVPELTRLYEIDQTRMHVLLVRLESERDLRAAVPPGAIFFQFANTIPARVGCRARVLHQQIAPRRLSDPLVRRNQAALQRRIASQNHVFFPSRYVREAFCANWKIEEARASVIYPPLEEYFLRPCGRREPVILSVARFDPIKRQREQLEAFRSIHPRLPPGSRLRFIGVARNRIARELEILSRDLPVEFAYDLDGPRLVEEYGKATLFWSTSGLPQPNGRPPDREAFGLSIVEAMAGGCVPVAVAGGGPDEYIEPGKNGELVTTQKELEEATVRSFERPEHLLRVAEAARQTAERFLWRHFRRQVLELFQGVAR